MPGRYWLMAGMVACAAAIAAPPSPGTPPPEASPPIQGAPDDDLIEFLGADDVGDAAWWEFFRKVPRRGENLPVPPPQEAKQ